MHCAIDLLQWPDSCCRPAECVRHLQVVLGQSKTDPSKYVAMKVVYLRSPDVLDDPEHLAILRRWGRSGLPHLCSKHCMRLMLPEHSCSACRERLDMRLFIRTAEQAGLAVFAYMCPVAMYRVSALQGTRGGSVSVGADLSQHPCTLLQQGQQQ